LSLARKKWEDGAVPPTPLHMSECMKVDFAACHAVKFWPVAVISYVLALWFSW